MTARAEASLVSLLSTLESKTAKRDDKIEAYDIICKNLKEEELSLFTQDITAKAKRILTVLRNDIRTEWDSVAQGALQVLGFCLHDPDTVRVLSAAEVKGVVADLCECVKKTVDKLTCTRALWCLSRQCLPPHQLTAQVDTILLAVAHALDHWKGQSITVEFEAVNTIARLQDQVPKEMGEAYLSWAKLLFPLLVHNAVKVREKAFTVLQNGPATIQTEKEFTTSLISDLKLKWIPELTKLFQSKNEMYVLSVWSFIIQILGKVLHSGSFINHILPLVELGFKSASPQVKCHAFEAWKHLIENFALDPDIICDAKRVKLIMQVFKINNAKVQSVAEKKFAVWWQFVRSLGPKLSSYFDQVCVPLLQMCVGSTKIGGNVAQSLTTPTFARVGMLTAGTSPITPRLNLSTPGSQLLTFPSLQLKGCEVLALLLGTIPPDEDISEFQLSIEPLDTEVMMGPSFFLKQSSTILSCAKELLISQGQNIQEGLLCHIWYSLVAHVKNVVESGAKSESRDVLTSFLNTFQLILLSEAIDYSKVLKLFQAVCCLPRKALCSTAYQIGGGEVLHGTPVMFLTELLLTPKLLESCAQNERYMSLFGLLVEIGVSHGAVLEFSQLILQVLDRHAQFVASDQLWRMWSLIITPLEQHVIETNEVNQGDVLEHDFTCMYTALIFPVSRLLTSNLAQGTMKTMLKSWSDLYKTFARLSSMVTNAEANVSCEQLSHRIHTAVDFSLRQELSFLEPLAQMLEVILGQVDFSSLGAPRAFTATLSPSRWTKKKQRPLENIHSFVTLLSEVLMSLYELATASSKTPGKQKNQALILSVWSCIVGMLTLLFSHVTSSQIIGSLVNRLAGPMGKLFQLAGGTGGPAYPASFLQKLERLWLDVATCLQTRYTGGYDTDLLFQLSPLLEATFSHSRRQIKTQTVILWNATFSKSLTLNYPETLKPILMKVKEKTPIILPGWISTDIPVIEETPVSQFSQAGSCAPEPHLPGMPSPRKVCGSFLNKAVSPNIKKSPARPPAPKFDSKPVSASKAKKNLSLLDMRDEEFVVIAPSPKQKRVLTEHQKEVLRERSILPAMYNNLELSQDVSLSAHFITDAQSESGSLSDSVVLWDSDDVKQSKDTTDQQSETRAAKRRRSIRFSDEVFEEPAEQKAKQNTETKQATVAEGAGEGKCDENGPNKEHGAGKESSDSVLEDVPSQGSDLSLKPNLQRAMGGLLSDIPSTPAGKSSVASESDKSASASSLQSNKNEKILQQEEMLKEKASVASSVLNSSRTSSFGQLFSCSDDSCSVSMMTPVNMDSVVEETQDMLSPERAEPAQADKETVIETPVKSVDDSFALATTPTSRALFHSQSEENNHDASDPSLSAVLKKSPVVKIHRLSGKEIRKFSPHRMRRSENDDIVLQSQPDSTRTGQVAAARVRRSLSHPQSVHFGREITGSKRNMTNHEKDTSELEQDSHASTGGVTSPDIQLSQGFSTACETSDSRSKAKDESSVIEIDCDVQKNISVVGEQGKAENGQEFSSPELITSTQIETCTSPYVPDLAAPTLKNSKELFADFSPVAPSNYAAEEEGDSEPNSSTSIESQDIVKTEEKTPNTYNPELASTLVASSEAKSRRKSHVPVKSEPIVHNTRARRKSTPAVQTSKAKGSRGMQTRLSGEETRTKDGDSSAMKHEDAKAMKPADCEIVKPKQIENVKHADSEKVKHTQNEHVKPAGNENVKLTGSENVTRPSNEDANPSGNDGEISDTNNVRATDMGSSQGHIVHSGKIPNVVSGKAKNKPETKRTVRKTRRSCTIEAKENTDTSSQDSMDLSGSESIRPRRRSAKALKDSQNEEVVETKSKDVTVPRRGLKRGRRGQEKQESEQVEPSDVEMSSVCRTGIEDVPVSGNKHSSVDDNSLTAIPEDMSPDRTPDSREIVQKEPQRQSTLIVKRDAKLSGSNCRPDTPKARKSLTTVDPFDSEESVPLSTFTSQDSSVKTDMLTEDSKKQQDSEEKTMEAKVDTVTTGVSSATASRIQGDIGDKVETRSEKVVDKKGGKTENSESKTTNKVCTPTRKAAPKYKVAKMSPINLRTRSAQKTKKVEYAGQRGSPKSATKGKRISLTRKKLNVEEDTVTTEKGIEEEMEDKVADEVNEEKETFKPMNVSVEVPQETENEEITKTSSDSLPKQVDSEEVFTEIKSPGHVRFADEVVDDKSKSEEQGEQESPIPHRRVDLGTPSSDSKMLASRNLPWTERESCKTSPRGILKHTGASRGFSKVQRFSSPWTRMIHKKKVHPVTVPHLYSPAASPSASILKRRRLSGDMPTNSPSPPQKQRRVSFAEPISMAEEAPCSSQRLTHVNRCLDLPTPSSPSTSHKKGMIQSQSQSSCGSTQESQLNCTEPVYPQLQQCTKPVENVLSQLTSSMWSRGLEQLVRARNIRTVGDLCNLSEYEVHNLPIRSPKVPTLRKVLKQFENRTDRKTPVSGGSGGVTGGSGGISGGNKRVSGDNSGISEGDARASETGSGEGKDMAMDPSYTPPGSPPDANTANSLMPDQAVQLDDGIVLNDDQTLGDKNLAQEDGDPVAMETVAKDTDDDEVLPAVEDALSELSPSKGELMMNTSIDGIDEECDMAKVSTDNDVNEESDDLANDLPMGNGVSSGENMAADKAGFLRHVEMYSGTFTSAEIGEFRSGEILKLHANLITLLNATASALRSKCMSPDSQS